MGQQVSKKRRRPSTLSAVARSSPRFNAFALRAEEWAGGNPDSNGEPTQVPNDELDATGEALERLADQEYKDNGDRYMRTPAIMAAERFRANTKDIPRLNAQDTNLPAETAPPPAARRRKTRRGTQPGTLGSLVRGGSR